MKHLLLTVTIMFSSITFWAQECEDNLFDFIEVSNDAVYSEVGNDGWLWFDDDAEVSAFGLQNDNSFLPTIILGTLWFAATDESGTHYATAQKYQTEEWRPGPIFENNSDPQEGCSAFDYVVKITAEEVNNFLNGAEVPESFYRYPAKDNPHLEGLIGKALPEGRTYAPFYDFAEDDIYNPDDGDFPLIKGVEQSFFIINDLYVEENHGTGEAIGIELLGSAFLSGEALTDTVIYYEYEIRNVSGRNYPEFRCGLQTDPDLGFFQDDYTGCFPDQNIAYVYNGDSNDEDYFENLIPIVGVQLLKNSKDESSASTMASYLTYNNDNSIIGNPVLVDDFVNFLDGRWKDGSPITFGGSGYDPNGTPTNYMYPDNPNDPDGWSECSEYTPPADRRFLSSFNSVSLNDKESYKITFAAFNTFRSTQVCINSDILNEMGQIILQTYEDLSESQEPTGIDKEEITAEFVIYPNPADQYFQLNTDLDLLEVYDVIGNEVISELNYLMGNEIDLSSLDSGIYFIRGILNENTYVQQIVKK